MPPFRAMTPKQALRLREMMVDNVMHDRAMAIGLVDFILEVSRVTMEAGCAPDQTIVDFIRAQAETVRRSGH